MSFDRTRLPDPTTYYTDQGLKLSGPRTAKWKTTACNFHQGSDSMRVKMDSGAWVCMACAAKGGDVLSYHMQMHGLEFVAAAKELGAWVDDDRPSRPQKPTPLPARAALEVLQQEATVAAVAAANVGRGVVLSDVDRTRLLQAAGRISRIVEAFHE